MPASRQILALVVASLFGFTASAEERSCLENTLAAPQSRAANCFARLAGRSPEGREARHELERLVASQPKNAYWVVALGYTLDRELGCKASLPLFRRAAELFAAEGNAEEILARTNLVACLDRTGDLEEADLEAARLLQLAQHSANPLEVARARLRQAQVALSGGDLRRAETLLLTLGHEDLESLGAGPTMDWRIQHGRLNLAYGRAQEALRDYEALAQLAEKSQDKVLAARAAYSIAVARERFEPTVDARQAALEAARNSLERAVRSGDQGVLIPSLLLVSRFERNVDMALTCGQLAASAGDPGNLTACLFAAAAMLAGSQPAQAERLLQEGLKAGAAAADPFTLLQPWGDQLRALFALREREKALAMAGELLGRVEQLRNVETRPERRAELFGVWRRLHSWLAGELLRSQDPAEQAQAFLLLEKARARELREALALHGATSKVQGLREVEATLAANEAMLTFHLGNRQDIFGNVGDGSAVFVSTRLGTRVALMPDQARLDAALDLWLGSIEGRTEEKALAAAIGNFLWAPIAASLPAEIDRLILVPDGGLYRLPWALLRDAAGEQLLIQRYEITLEPSASFARDAQAPPLAGGALVLADPAFSGAALPRLPLARREGQEIQRLLGGRLLEGELATKEALLESDLEDIAVLHFAAHALLDSELPEHSALLLAQQGEDSGRLEPREIAHLTLSGQLVTLASCRSARGRILPGEGPMSLGRAFLAAGAPAVLGSLWPLRDDEAAVFFARFYRHLGQGERASTALALTQRELAAQGEPAAAWAGVVLLGDGNLRLEKRPPGKLVPFSLGAAVCLLALATLLALRLLRP